MSAIGVAGRRIGSDDPHPGAAMVGPDRTDRHWRANGENAPMLKAILMALAPSKLRLVGSHFID